MRTETIEGVTLNGAPMVRAWSVTPGLVVGSQYKPSGALRKSTPSGRPHRVTVVGYAAKTNTHDRDKLTCVGSIGRWETLDANGCLPMGAMPYCSTAPVYAVTIKHGGRTMVGHGPWSAKKVRTQGQTRAEQRTRSIARKAKVAAITHQAVTDSEAIDAAIALSHSLAESTEHSETVQTGSNAPAPRPTTDSVKINLTHRDIVVTIGKAKGRPFRVTIVHGKVRHQTTSTAPDYVGRVLANRLAVIG